MRTILKIILGGFLFIFFLFIIDLYVFRGYFSTPLFDASFNNYTFESKEIKNTDCEFTIEKNKNLYILTFENNSFKPFLIWTYRWDTPFFKINDTTFFQHTRLKANFPKYKNSYKYGLDCGSDAGDFSINPYEKFSVKFNNQEILNLAYWGAYHQYNEKNDTIMDLIYNKPLIHINGRKNTFKLFKRNDISKKDSIAMQLYFPLFSYNNKELFYVKSNYIKLSYKDIINKLVKEKSQVFNHLNNL